MNVIAYDIRPRPERAQELVFRCVSLDDLLTGSDIISRDANLNTSSYHILNGEAFAKRGRELILGDLSKIFGIDLAMLRQERAREIGATGFWRL